jgi:hypothetical protein
MDIDKYEIGSKNLERHRDIMNQVGDLLTPKTLGFAHINLDMTFTDLGASDIVRVENLCKIIDVCHIKGLKQSEYIARGELAVILNTRKSKDARTMKLFTDVNHNAKQTYKDETDETKGFTFMKKKSKV